LSFSNSGSLFSAFTFFVKDEIDSWTSDRLRFLDLRDFGVLGPGLAEEIGMNIVARLDGVGEGLSSAYLVIHRVTVGIRTPLS
jgi:hypothetical protein